MSTCLPPGPIASTSGLRVFPTPLAPNTADISPQQLSSFQALNQAFQHATGWRLKWNAPSAYGSPSSDASRRNCADHDWLRIDDLSDVVPPGIPATSRIYCEHLVLRLNRLLDDLQSRKTLVKEPEFGASVNRTAVGSRMGIELQPSHLDQVSIVPLPTDMRVNVSDRLTFCQWSINGDGEVLTGVFSLHGSSDQLATAQVATQSSFLAAAATSTECSFVVNMICEVIEQMFCGDVFIQSMVLSLNPLIGQAQVYGDSGFSLTLDRETLSFAEGQNTSFSWYRNQILLINDQPCGQVMDRDLSPWKTAIMNHLILVEPQRWPATAPTAIAECIPSIVDQPQFALAMRRN